MAPRPCTVDVRDGVEIYIVPRPLTVDTNELSIAPPAIPAPPRYRAPFDMYKLLDALAAVSRSTMVESDMYDVEMRPDTLTEEKFACCELINIDDMKERRGPVAPVAPVGPVAPVAPVAPVGPVAPVAPAPELPPCGIFGRRRRDAKP